MSTISSTCSTGRSLNTPSISSMFRLGRGSLGVGKQSGGKEDGLLESGCHLPISAKACLAGSLPKTWGIWGTTVWGKGGAPSPSHAVQECLKVHALAPVTLLAHSLPEAWGELLACVDLYTNIVAEKPNCVHVFSRLGRNCSASYHQSWLLERPDH